MCGRYAYKSNLQLLCVEFGVELTGLSWSPRYNLAPMQQAPVIFHDGRGRRAAIMRWGLVPRWADDPAVGSRMINARSESAADKPAFKEALRLRRCLVPADGFYEWAKHGKVRQPYYIHRADGQPLALAGIWERWTPRQGGRELLTFAILTTSANSTIQPLHDRMPVILEPEAWADWLSNDLAPSRVSELMRPAAEGVLAFHAVSRRVNHPAADDPTCIQPVPDDAPGGSMLF
jgi:putative SOS response-associated peptidase YedK